jgi:hypothetical protein
MARSQEPRASASKARCCACAKLSFRATPQAPMSAFSSGLSRATCQSSILGLDDVPPEPRRTVAKPRLLKLLGLPLSEKQIPQVVEILESGGKSKEAL